MAIQHFKCGDTTEVCNGIIDDIDMKLCGIDNEELCMVHVKKPRTIKILFTVPSTELTMSHTEMERNGLSRTILHLLISGGRLQWRLKTVPSVRFYHELHHHLLCAELNQREIGRIYRYMFEVMLIPRFPLFQR